MYPGLAPGCAAAPLRCVRLAGPRSTGWVVVVVRPPASSSQAVVASGAGTCCEQEKLPRLLRRPSTTAPPSSRLNNYNTSAHLRLASSPATSTMCSGGLNKHRGAPQSHLRCGVKYFLVVTEYFPADVEQERYLAWPGVTSGDHLHISASRHLTQRRCPVSQTPSSGAEMKSPLSFRRTIDQK